jgi:hypothetical protein
MEIKGQRLIVVRDGKGQLLDVICFFTAQNGNHIALYAFNFKLSKKSQENVQHVIEGAKTLARMKESTKVIGREPADAKTQRVAGDVHTLVPNDEGPGKIRIFDVGKNSFKVRIRIPQKKGTDAIILDAPFEGAPGKLEGKIFDGEIAHLADSSADVAKVMVEVLNIPDSGS